MKAIVAAKYGTPEVLQLKEIEKPTPKDNEVLIKIHAATVTAGDCEIRRFDISVLFWLFLRVALAIKNPKKILGQELSGEIEAVGKKVTKFKPGDAVFAPTSIGLGAYAEYICLAATYPVPFNPDNMSFEEAATIPTGGINGLHFIQKAKIQTGEKVLINGAGGSIGTYAVQLAKTQGAEITAVDSAIKLDMLRTLGADHVIDYQKEDFTKRNETYDVIIDIVGKSLYKRSVQLLKPNGRFILGNPGLGDMFRAMWTSRTTDKQVIFEFADYKMENLQYLRDLIESGELKPVIDKHYPLAQMQEAHRYVEQGLKKGNLIITI